MQPKEANEMAKDWLYCIRVPTATRRTLSKGMGRLKGCLNGRCAARSKFMADFGPGLKLVYTSFRLEMVNSRRYGM